MPLPSHDTRVTYPAGALVASTTVLHVAPVGDGRIAVITETTSFHPVDAAWPDQPADAGTLRVGGDSHVIRGAVASRAVARISTRSPTSRPWLPRSRSRATAARQCSR